MNIRNEEAYLASHWDWSAYNDCFTSGIKISDIDGTIERNGYFLLIETKSPDDSIPKGQRILHEALQHTGVFTVFVVWGRTNRPEQIQIYNRFKRFDVMPCNQADLQDRIKNWFDWANSMPKAPNNTELIQRIEQLRKELVKYKKSSEQLSKLLLYSIPKRRQRKTAMPGQIELLPQPEVQLDIFMG